MQPKAVDRSSVFAWCGALAAPLFLVAIVVFGAMRPDFDHAHKAVSELGVFGAPHALAWNLVGFIAVGLLVAVFSWGFFRATRSWAGLILIGLSGLAFAAAGVFSADMDNLSSASSRAHIAASYASFIAFAVGSFVLAWQLRHRDGWRIAAAISLFLGLLALASIPLRETGVPPGLAQRVGFAAYLAWTEALAIACLLQGVKTGG
jgi:hypothetical membrane protein